MNLKTSYYRNCILSIHRGFALGLPSNAKPIFLLSIIKGIDDGVILGNKIKYDKDLETIYYDCCLFYEPKRRATFFSSPFIIPLVRNIITLSGEKELT